MSRHVDPGLLRVARIVAIRFSQRGPIDRDEAIGWAYLAVAELLTKFELGPNDTALVRKLVKHRLIDWQRMDSPLSRAQIDRRSTPPPHLELDESNAGASAPIISDPWVQNAVMRLEPHLRDVIINVYFLDIHAAEYGRRINRTEERVSQLLKEARAALHQFLLDDFSK